MATASETMTSSSQNQFDIDKYCYRFIRMRDAFSGKRLAHLQEQTKPLAFYSPDEALCDRDLEWNEPINALKKAGKTPEMLYVIQGENGLIAFTKGFKPDHLLVRFTPSIAIPETHLNPFNDAQTGGSCGCFYFLGVRAGAVPTHLSDFHIEVFFDNRWRSKYYCDEQASAWYEKADQTKYLQQIIDYAEKT